MRTTLNAGSLRSVENVGYAVRHSFVYFVIGLCLASCEAHDYWLMSAPIEVDSNTGVYEAHSKDEISQDLFVRYELNYEIENVNTSQETEVVVSATSYVNHVERSTGQKVWHLNGSEKGAGVLTPALLSYGNSLSVSLFCCATSRCVSKEVSCSHLTANDGVDSGEDGTVSFCYKSCNTPEICINKCPSESVCAQMCKDADSIESCRRSECHSDAGLETCTQKCNGDEECLKSCTPARECVDKCYSNVAGCFKNCLSMAYLCTDNYYLSDAESIPCALCGGSGACSYDFSVQDTRKLVSSTGEEFTCDLDCSTYPPTCVTGCNELFNSDTEREDCLNQCLTQFLFWCNDNQISEDYIDSNIEQPCCYSDFCQNRLTGVIKSYGVECFNDTNCGSGKYCTEQGVCESSGNSTCSARPNVANKRPPLSLFIIGLLAISIYARFKRRKYRTSVTEIGAWR